MTTAQLFKVLGIHHVTIGVPNKAPLRHLRVEVFRSERENVDEYILVGSRRREGRSVCSTVSPTGVTMAAVSRSKPFGRI